MPNNTLKDKGTERTRNQDETLAHGNQSSANQPQNELKKARGLGSEAGHSPNEAGTDQRVEDAKRNRHSH